MDELLKRILPLALAAAVNPAVLAVVVATLTGSRRKATALCLGFTLAIAILPVWTPVLATVVAPRASWCPWSWRPTCW